ncbi:hypothetical protein [Hymenobacter oligotrophus]|uniref:hypothetical protein n=1 Tax=Hymenobacter oligotrophus TaxID=2319843 RepID=UPI0013C2C268|nr:hypothetical protein [Hymenobacter oligotrophus]
MLRLLPEGATVFLDYYDDEVGPELWRLDAGKRIVPLKKRRELIKLLVCADLLRHLVHIEISQGHDKYFNAYDRMMGCWIHKPFELPQRFISKYKLVEQETCWEFEADGFDDLEQWIMILE